MDKSKVDLRETEETDGRKAKQKRRKPRRKPRRGRNTECTENLASTGKTTNAPEETSAARNTICANNPGVATSNDKETEGQCISGADLLSENVSLLEHPRDCDSEMNLHKDERQIDHTLRSTQNLMSEQKFAQNKEVGTPKKGDSFQNSSSINSVLNLCHASAQPKTSTTPESVKPQPLRGQSNHNNRSKERPNRGGATGHQEASHSSKKKKHKKKKVFEEYWTKEKVSASLKRGEIFQGCLRISSKNYEMAWVTVPNFKRDIAILGMLARNRALNGDVVAFEILAKEKWSVMAEEMRYHNDIVEKAADQLTNLEIASGEGDNISEKSGKSPTVFGKESVINIHDVPEQFLQRTAKVVYIIEKKHTRVACGYLRLMTDPNDPDGLFSPTDSRLPRLRVLHDDCPPRFFDRPQDFQATLMIARLTEWRQDSPLDSFMACGTFARSLGEAGEIEPETDGILIVNGIDPTPFTKDVLDCLPKNLPWKIPEEELEARRDFRDVCVFTIDPASARDLDDAVHCTSLENGTFEVGVHIADVSFFIREGSALDEVASDRATSTYMVQKVIPMLPRLLCEELCSLNPGEDRLTFSVVWKIDKNGVIQDEWMGKGIIKSRVKLAYEHAQEMIDNPAKVWTEEEHPPVAGGTAITDVGQRVRILHKIATKLRRRRFENGTLRLNKAKVAFDLDSRTGLPIGWHPYEQRDSHRLIEEYMLLANMAVAHRIYDAFPDRALLRCHPKPDSRQLEEIRALCSSLGIKFSHESSKGIQDTLNIFKPNSPEHLVLSQLAMKPMKPAKYFGSASAEGDPEEFRHYALSVPLYTHFTSPIRRYPDVVVHRLLAASLNVGPVPEFTSEDLDGIAEHCNDKKQAAKRAGEASEELYLGAFIRECGPLSKDGIVTCIMHESVDVLVPDFGIIKRVYFKYCNEVGSFDFQEGHKSRPAKVTITWKNSSGKNSVERLDDETGSRRADTLTIFTRVRILLRTEGDMTKNKGGLKFCGELLPA